jgi:hypothetical protein
LVCLDCALLSIDKLTHDKTVYDILNVASIHNQSDSNTPSNTTLGRIEALASTHEFNLAYNSSDTIRAIAGMQLAGEILTSLSTLISSSGSAQKLAVQFGAYGTFSSLFGLVDIVAKNPQLTNIVDYASSMTFELFTEADASNGFPGAQDLQVRFLFHNGTSSNASEPVAYPLFGGNNNAVGWTEFQDKMGKFAVKDTKAWCGVCGNTGGACAAYAEPKKAAGASSSGNGISPAIGGVIGAFVTLAVLLGALAAGMLLGGFAVVRKKGGAKGERGVEKENVETKV